MKPTSRLLLLLVLMAACTIARADFPVRMVGEKAWLPAVAYNSTDHEYLVVWSEDINTGTVVLSYVFGQRVSENGTMLGSPFVVFYYGVNPVVAYNSSAHEYLIGFNPGGGYVGQRVSSDGTPIGNATQLMDGASYGRLMYNSLTGQYLFVGADIRETLPTGGYTMKIYSRKIGSDGQAVNSPVFVDSLQFGANTPAEGKFSAAFAPIQSTETPYGRYLLAISAYGTMFLEFLDSDGSPMDVVNDPSHAGVQYRYVPFKTGTPLGGLYDVDVVYGDQSSYSMTGPAFLVVWADQNNTWNGQSWTGIWGGFVDATKIAYSTSDVISDYAFPISAIADHWTRDPEIETYGPQATYNPSSQKFYVVWREMPGTSPYNNATVNHVRGNYVFESIPAHNVVISATNGTEDPHRPTVAASTSSEHALVVWEDYRNGVCNIYGNVEKVADAVTPPPVSGLRVVTNTLDGGSGSLRQAILDANAHAGMDTITFNIPGSGAHTIMPATPLPRLTGPVLIDGYTQPGSNPNTNTLDQPDNASLTIVLDGSSIIEPSGQLAGLRLYGGNSTIRGLVISSFAWGGIFIDSCRGNAVEGNFIGTDYEGLTGHGNLHGIQVGSSGSVTIGGSTPAARNIISGNTQSGVFLFGSNSVVQGNYIGLGVDGAKAVANDVGVLIWGDSVLIGGTSEAQGNVISGNGTDGIMFNPQQVCRGWVQGNRIGTQAGGVNSLPNGGYGIILNTGCDGVLIGGSSPGAGNIIAYNSSDGVKISGGALVQPPRGNRISRNSIFLNGGLGINLGGGWEVHGVTSNDYQDIDSGPNNLQNYPVIKSAIGGDYLDVTGSLNSTPSATFTIEFFSTSPACVSTGRDGQTYLGSTVLTTDTAGNVSFDATIGTAVSANQSITATATDKDGNTSEFSAPIASFAAGPEVVTTTSDSGPGSLRQAILNANAKPGRDTIAFNLPGSGVQSIVPKTSLPPITDPVVVDGYTQPGSSVNTNGPGMPDNAVLKVVLDGSATGTYLSDSNGFMIHASNCCIRGMVFNSFGGAAVYVDSGSGNVIEGNFFGTDCSGHQRRILYYGVTLNESSYNTVGGADPSSRNVISCCEQAGILVSGSRSVQNIIRGNFVGTTASGDSALPGQLNGIIIDAAHNTVGGTVLGSANVVSGSMKTGVSLSGDSNLVVGNLIGTDLTGTKAVGNFAGVHIDGSANVIGGRSRAAANVISGNTSYGVEFYKFGMPNQVIGNKVQGNFIGTQSDGSTPLGNNDCGILISDYCQDNAIGDSLSGAGNIIAFSANDGVRIEASSTTFGLSTEPAGNRIMRNSIFGNGKLGINLVGGTEDSLGVTMNDSGDLDRGPNLLQNFPVLITALGGNNPRVYGGLNGTPNARYLIEFFATPANGEPRRGEGETYVGSFAARTDGTGNADFVAPLNAPLSEGRAITATATDSLGSTSEFSMPRISLPDDVATASGTPSENLLMQNYPNPFNPTTTIRYALAQRSEVSLTVFNALGQKVASLVSGTVEPGYHEVHFDGGNFASGVYFYRLTAGSYTCTMKFVCVK